MRTFRLIGLFCFIGILGCENLDLKEDVPECVEKKIKEFKDSDLTCDSGANVIRYDFQGMQVYLFDPGNCGADMQAPIYDEQCNIICGLGGFAGNVMCNGVNFGENATNPTLIWED